MGQTVAVTNALGNVTVYEYDLRGNRTYEGGATYPVRYVYDVFGNKTTMTTYRNEASGVGDTTTWTYDEASGVLLSKTYAVRRHHARHRLHLRRDGPPNLRHRRRRCHLL